MELLSLTKEEVELLISVSKMDVYPEYNGGWEGDYKICPCCKVTIDELIPIDKILSKEEFYALVDLDPDKPDPYSAEDIYHYSFLDSEPASFYRQQIIDLYPERIAFPHKEGCKIDKLKSLAKKMKTFIDK
jgi:hypothetical protein